MKLYNLKDHNEQVSFAQAIKQGLGKNQGLFFPLELPEFELTEIDSLLKQDFVTRSANILSAYLADEFAPEVIYDRVKAAFAFPAPVAQVEPDIAALELFHGPTLAFKDFGGRFMAQMLQEVAGRQRRRQRLAADAAPGIAFGGLHGVRRIDLYAAVLGRDVGFGGWCPGLPDRPGRCGCSHQPVPALGREAAGGRRFAR